MFYFFISLEARDEAVAADTLLYNHVLLVVSSDICSHLPRQWNNRIDSVNAFEITALHAMCNK